MPRLEDRYWGCTRAPKPGARSAPATRVEEMLAASAAGPDPDSARALSRPRPSWHHRALPRGLVLFSVGAVLALVLNLLQVQRSVTLFPDEALAAAFSSAWWVPPCCGTAAGE